MPPSSSSSSRPFSTRRGKRSSIRSARLVSKAWKMSAPASCFASRLRTKASLGKRSNGSDESATIMSIPDLAVLREITMEGEAIRDAVPDPKGRYLYLLGRHVHIFDINGEKELRTISIDDPMAIAPSANGSLLAVVAPEDFGNTKATSVAFFD